MSDLNPDVTAAADTAPANDLHADPVLIYEAVTGEEANVVRTTLASAGIATFQPGDTANPYFGAIDANVDSVWMHHIYVAPSNVEAARALLNAAVPTEEELAAEAEADPTTLAEAEARVRNA